MSPIQIFSENSELSNTKVNTTSAVVPATPELILLLPFPLASFILFQDEAIVFTTTSFSTVDAIRRLKVCIILQVTI
jgi:hypothetical protein